MPGPTALFYVSGHGYGHARRSAEVMRALRRLVPDIALHARTSARGDIFADLLASPVAPSAIDLPVFEKDALSINWPATFDAAADRLARRQAVVRQEAEAVRHVNPSILVADGPFIAGDVAEALGVPCVAVTNFTWDWIYEPYAAQHHKGESVVRAAREGYGKMATLLQLPFGHDAPAFREVMPVPLVARRSVLTPREVLSRLGLDPADRRPRVLLALRGGVPGEALARGARAAPGFQFLTTQPANLVPPDMPPNVRVLSLGGLDFSDLLVVSDVVLSKLGYGTIAEAIAAGTRLLWPRREGFREDEVTAAEAPQYLRMTELPRDDFDAGRWSTSLEKLMALPPPGRKISCDGAAACAEVLATRFLSA